MTIKGLFTHPRSPELFHYHQMQFSIIPRTPLYKGYCQRILSPTDRAFKGDEKEKTFGLV